MKKLIFILFLPFLSLYAQNDDFVKIESNLKVLFDNCQNDKFDEAATLLVYNGEDTKRKYKDSFDLSSRKEKREVKRTCRKIKALLDVSSSYNTSEKSVETNNKMEFYIIKVDFKSGSQNITTAFSFVKVGDKFLLAEIN